MNRGRPPEKAGKEDYFANQLNKLKEIYNPSFILSTDDYNAAETARKVARHVLLGSYAPADLQGIISRYE